MISEISSEKFYSCPLTRKIVLERVISILDDLDLQPVWHPMREGFWFNLVYPAVDLRRRIKNHEGSILDVVKDENVDFWNLVWKVATSSEYGTLHDMAKRIEWHVFPVIELTCEKRDLVRKLEMEEREFGMMSV